MEATDRRASTDPLSGTLDLLSQLVVSPVLGAQSQDDVLSVIVRLSARTSIFVVRSRYPSKLALLGIASNVARIRLLASLPPSPPTSLEETLHSKAWSSERKACWVGRAPVWKRLRPQQLAVDASCWLLERVGGCHLCTCPDGHVHITTLTSSILYENIGVRHSRRLADITSDPGPEPLTSADRRSHDQRTSR